MTCFLSTFTILFQLWKCYYTVEDRWRIYKCRDNWSDQCSCRKKREISNYDDDDIDEFLTYADRENFSEGHEWYQGEFEDSGEVGEELDGHRSKRGILSKCSCSRNVSHPM